MTSLPTVQLPQSTDRMIDSRAGGGVATRLIGYQYPETVCVGDHVWHRDGYAAVVVTIDSRTGVVYALAGRGRSTYGHVLVSDGEWTRAPWCDYCDQLATRAPRGATGEFVCDRCARSQYDADWQAETCAYGVKIVREYVASQA